MPTYASDDDRRTDQAISKWRQTAADEIDNIGGWRDDPTELLVRGWDDLDKDFLSMTKLLLVQLAEHYQTSDPMALWDVYEPINRWHEDHSAEHLPRQDALWRRLDRANVLLLRIEVEIENRVLKDSNPPTQWPPTDRQLSIPMSLRLMCKALGVADNRSLKSTAEAFRCEIFEARRKDKGNPQCKIWLITVDSLHESMRYKFEHPEHEWPPLPANQSET